MQSPPNPLLNPNPHKNNSKRITLNTLNNIFHLPNDRLDIVDIHFKASGFKGFCEIGALLCRAF